MPSLTRTVLKPSVLQRRGTRRQRQLVVTDGGWWMVDGGGWWMVVVVVDGGGWSKKKFSDFSLNLHIDSTPKVNFLVFGVKRENFLMGLKIDFEVENLGFLGFFS